MIIRILRKYVYNVRTTCYFVCGDGVPCRLGMYLVGWVTFDAASSKAYNFISALAIVVLYRYIRVYKKSKKKKKNSTPAHVLIYKHLPMLLYSVSTWVFLKKSIINTERYQYDCLEDKLQYAYIRLHYALTIGTHEKKKNVYNSQTNS